MVLPVTPHAPFIQLSRWIRDSTSAIAFTGAGISTESGIPDFRSPGGVWARSQPVMYQEFLNSAEARTEYWRQKSLTHHEFVKAEPNIAHRRLVEWERLGHLRGVITQNIDGLHTEAGTQNLLELHGSAMQVGCLECEERFPAGPYVELFEGYRVPPDCPECGGLLKHATISFGQALDEEVISEAQRWTEQADLYIVLGSSLVVHPAAALPALAKALGARLVIINRTKTPLDDDADFVIRAGLGETLEAISL